MGTHWDGLMQRAKGPSPLSIIKIREFFSNVVMFLVVKLNKNKDFLLLVL